MVEEDQGIKILEDVTSHTGMLWERIANFRKQIQEIPGALEHHTTEMDEAMPLKHHIKDGVYTREIFMPHNSCKGGLSMQTNLIYAE